MRIWLFFGILGLVILAYFAYTGLVLYKLWPLDEFSIAKAGQFGDCFGVMSCLFSGLALCLVAVTVNLQIKDLQEQRKTATLARVSDGILREVEQFRRDAEDVRFKRCIGNDHHSNNYSDIRATVFFSNMGMAILQLSEKPEKAEQLINILTEEYQPMWSVFSRLYNAYRVADHLITTSGLGLADAARLRGLFRMCLDVGLLQTMTYITNMPERPSPEGVAESSWTELYERLHEICGFVSKCQHY